jgi:hypothetical protein
VHRAQLERTLEVLGQAIELDDYVTAVGARVRLADPRHGVMIADAAATVGYQPGVDPARTVIDVAHNVATDPHAGPLGRIAALRPIHHLYAHRQTRLRRHDIGLFVTLAQELAALGDNDQAMAVADTGREAAREAGADAAAATLQALRLRLLVKAGRRDRARVVADQVGARAGEPPTSELDAQAWATIIRLDDPSTRVSATAEAEALLPRLDTDLGAEAGEWLLLVGYHLGRVGYPDLARFALSPLLKPDARPEGRQAADAVLRVTDSHHADDLLYLIALQHDHSIASLLITVPGASTHVCTTVTGPDSS